MTSQQGNISIHAQNIMPIIKRWLYSDKDIFIREMVSNGCDAITKQKMLSPGAEEDWRVTVTLDAEKGELSRRRGGAHRGQRHRYDRRRGGKVHQSGGLLRRGGVPQKL